MTDIREAMRQVVKGDLIPVDVPEWGMKVHIRRLVMRDQLNRKEEADPRIAGLKLLMETIVDENGERLLSDEDFELLLDQPLAILMPLFTESAKQNGFTTKELEEAVTLFANSPGAVSSTE